MSLGIGISQDALEEVLDFLDQLRESGATNMHAAASFIEDEFGYSRSESRIILKHWMDTFSERQSKKASQSKDVFDETKN